jgi:cytochrome b561
MNYSLHSKLIHWLMSIMILGMLFIGFFLDDFPVAQKAFVYTIHKSTGLLLMVLVIIRLAMRFTSSYPALPDSTPTIVVHIAKWNVFGLYLMMILMPLSGFLMSSLSGYPVPFYGLFTIDSLWQNKLVAGLSHEFHEIGGYIFALLIAGHILGGLFHHFVLKDGVLKRII